jgi:hypothetical protein
MQIAPPLVLLHRYSRGVDPPPRSSAVIDIQLSSYPAIHNPTLAKYEVPSFDDLQTR